MRIRGPWLLVVLCVAFVVTDTVINALVQPLLSTDSTVVHGWPLIPAAAMGSAVMGALILAKLPRHPIGLLLVAVGTATSFSLLCEIYSIWVVEADGRGTAFTAAAAGWLSASTEGIAGLTGVTLIFILAPDGRLPSPRWRWAAWLAVLGLLLNVIGLLNSEPSIFTGRRDLGSTDTVASVFFSLGFLLVSAMLLVSVASLVLRLRRASGETRQQLRWFALAASAIGVGVLVLIITQSLNGGEQTWISSIPLQVSFVLLPVFLAVAVLRYRLYDVDVIVNRAAVVGAAALFVAIGYTVLVVIVGNMLGGAASGFWPSLLATAVVAMAFQPLRRRVVRFADRLAYGDRAAPYDALSSFSRQLGESPDLDSLLPAVAEAAGRAASANRCVVTLEVDNADASTASWSRSSRAALLTVGTEVTVAVRDAAGPLGSITVTPGPGTSVRPQELELLEDIAEHVAVAFRNARLQAELSDRVIALDRQTIELAASRRRLFAADDAERRRIEAAIERDVMPTLTRLTDALAPSSATIVEPDELVGLATISLDALRELTRGIFPTVLARSGVPAALSSHLSRVGSPGRLKVDEAVSARRFASRAEAAIFYAACAADAAGPIGGLHLGLNDGCLVLVVEDATPLGAEREAVLDRLEALGGSLLEEGGQLVVTLPATQSRLASASTTAPTAAATGEMPA